MTERTEVMDQSGEIAEQTEITKQTEPAQLADFLWCAP